MAKKDYLNLDGLKRFYAKIQEKIAAVSGILASHTGNKSNPHGVTKSQIGLGNVPNVTTNDQTPTYSQASSLTNLTSGEKLSVSLGKAMKAIADFIVHKADAVIHITAAERTKWNAVTNKVDKVSGKQLSTNDYTTAEKTKLSGIATGAEVNVQPDWDVTDVESDAYIKNRPTAFPPSSHTHDDRYFTEAEMNTKLGTKVDVSGGDIAATKVGSITASTASYPIPAANDTTKIWLGKIVKFFGDVKNWMTGVCLIGQIVNNCVTNNAGLPLSAAQGKVLMDLLTKLNSDKAPTSHASTATTYGRGNASSYGHVKVSDNYSSSAGAASAGVAASSKAVYDGWSNLDSKKIDKLHITSSTLFANFRFESTAGMIAGLYLCGNVSAGKQTAVLFMIALNKSATALTTDGVRFVDLLNNQSQLISSILFVYEPSLSTYRIKFNLKGAVGQLI